LWSHKDARQIRDHILHQFDHASRIKDPEERAPFLNFSIVGAGFTGVEMVGELLEWTPALAKEFRIDPNEISINLIEAAHKVLPIFNEKLQKKAHKYLVKHGVNVMLEAPITKADETGFVIGEDQKIESQTLIWAAGVRGTEFSSKLAITKGKFVKTTTEENVELGECEETGCAFDEDLHEIEGKRGRILVKETMESVDHPQVYIVGDAVWYVEEERVLPQIVETAIQTAHTACKNIISEIKGKVVKTKFHSKYHGHMVSIGGKYGVAHVMGIQLSGFFAMGAKHLINIIHLFGLAGLNAAWQYIKDRFLTVQHNRSIFGGILAQKSQSYFLLPLRIFVGILWLLEGIKKITDGWLENVYIVVDANSAATAWEETESAVTPLLSEPSPIYTWIMDTFVSSAPIFFQGLITFGEIAIGLALIGGLFTFLSAGASILLSVMFILGALADQSILWFIFAGIALMAGAGRSFGLDYWVQPWIKKWWNGTGLARQTYLYFDEPEIKKKKK
jgi:NADH dehydrogenase